MRKVFSRIVMLLIFAALLFPKSYAQIVGFYPEADTIFVGWGCTTPLIVCSLNPTPPAQDIINVTPDWNTWMWYNDALGIQNMVDFGYFLVDNPQNQFEYELWYIPEGWPLFPTAVPFDSVFM